MLTIIVPDDNKPLLRALGKALQTYADGVQMIPEGGELTIKTTETTETTTKAPGTSSLTGKKIPTTDDRKETTTGEPALIDEMGVVFNAEFCGKAKDPFYKSGKHAGQWKKRQGVDQADYDNWYVNKLADVQADTRDTSGDPAINTAEAFGGKTEEAPEQEAPTDAGSFMAWISEHQAAERLTQTDIDLAYQATGVEVSTLFNPATAAEAVAKVYAVLNAQLGGAA